MTTLQAFFGQAVQSTTKARDHGRFKAIARTALGAAILVALLAAGLALRALMFVPLS